MAYALIGIVVILTFLTVSDTMINLGRRHWSPTRELQRNYNTASAPRLRGLKPGTLEREFGRSLANSRIKEPGITQKKENL